MCPPPAIGCPTAGHGVLPPDNRSVEDVRPQQEETLWFDADRAVQRVRPVYRGPHRAGKVCIGKGASQLLALVSHIVSQDGSSRDQTFHVVYSAAWFAQFTASHRELAIEYCCTLPADV